MSIGISQVHLVPVALSRTQLFLPSNIQNMIIHVILKESVNHPIDMDITPNLSEGETVVFVYVFIVLVSMVTHLVRFLLLCINS